VRDVLLRQLRLPDSGSAGAAARDRRRCSDAPILRLGAALFVLGRKDGQEKKNQEAKAMARACISRIIKYVKYTRKSGTSVTVEKTMAVQFAERLSLGEDATSNAATYVMSSRTTDQGKKLARLEADGVQVKSASASALRRSMTTAAWSPRPRTRKSLQVRAWLLGRSRLPPPVPLTGNEEQSL
jgi:hypothetical protein